MRFYIECPVCKTSELEDTYMKMSDLKIQEGTSIHYLECWGCGSKFTSAISVLLENKEYIN